MEKTIKVASGEIVYNDESLRNFSSLEQLLLVISEEYDRHGPADRVRVHGIDEQGRVYRLGLDFASFQFADGDAATNLSLESIRKQKLLGQLLTESGIISEEQLKKAIEEQGRNGVKEKLGEVLIRLGYCSPVQVLGALAKQMGIDLRSPGYPL